MATMAITNHHRPPLFADRATAIRQASIQATDQPPPDDDAVIANQPVNDTQTQLALTGTTPTLIENPDGLTKTGNNYFVNDIYQYLFGPTPDISPEIFTHTIHLLDDLDCTADQPWTIPAIDIYQACLTNKHLQNLTQTG